MQPRVPIKNAVPAELDSRLRDELAPGEQIIWSAQPLPRAFRAASIGLFFFGLFWNAILLAVLTGFILGRKQPNGGPSIALGLFFIPFIVVGLATITSPIWISRQAKRMVYAITNRRALIVTGGWRGGVTVESFAPDRLGSMTRKERRDGSGDLIFEQFRERRGSGSTTVRRGFMGVADVKAIEELLTHTLLADRVRAV